jgi:hypothetical protein
MIRFAAKPDSLFCELINSAITDIVQNYLSFDDARDQEDWLCACMPRGARFFSATQAKEQLLALQHIQQDNRLYQITKYHWLLLYECLETYAHAFNEQPLGWLVRNYGIQQLDFSHLIKLYFWDLSFLSDHLAKMSRQESRTMLIWPETVGLTAGFKTHPDELTFTLCDEAITRDYNAQSEVRAWSFDSRAYPNKDAPTSDWDGR